jgi:hypothetical protein
MTAPTTRATPKKALDQRATSRHDNALGREHQCGRSAALIRTYGRHLLGLDLAHSLSSVLPAKHIGTECPARGRRHARGARDTIRDTDGLALDRRMQHQMRALAGAIAC